jgi:transglutaminase-like putative cysteine protease
VNAKASDFMPAVTVLKMHIHIEVDARGMETIDETLVTRIERKDAVDAHANRRIDFSPTMHHVEILEAYTIDPKGLRHTVPSSAIRTQENAINTTASQFSDYRYKVVVFPKADVGSVLHLRHRIKTFRQRLPGQMFYRRTLNPRLIFEDVRFSLTHPASLDLQVGVRDMNGGKVSTAGGKISYRYEHRLAVARDTEPAAVSASDYTPYFAASTYRDRLDQGRDYQKHAASRSMVTPEVQAIANEVTRSIEDRRGQIDALYRWVTQNIRYVSVIVDRSGLIPNTTRDILQRKYGDCKDHVTLLGALLRAKGIESSPALINLGEAYVLDGPATISPFNHVILYLPQENVYLDSTSQTLRPGQLYTEIAGKPVVLTALGKLGRTPDFTPETNRAETHVELVIDGQGQINGRAVERFSGDVEMRLRDWAISSQSNSMAQNVRSILDQHKERGAGSYTMGDPYDLSKPFEVVNEYELDPVTNVPGPAGWRIPNGLMSSVIRGELDLGAEGVRRTPFICSSRTVVERYRIHFPDTMKIHTLPPDIRYEGKNISYSATYVREGNSVKVERRAVKNYGKSVCSPSEWGELKAYQAAIRLDLRAQFVY